MNRGANVFRVIDAAETVSETAAITRGCRRMLWQQGFSSITELTLPNGRRADIVALGRRGEITIIEVKSCLADFRADAKWPDYAPYCDAFYFAVNRDFPADRIPEETGLIIADAYGAAITRDAVPHPVASARRRKLLIDIARLSSDRLHAAEDGARDQL